MDTLKDYLETSMSYDIDKHDFVESAVGVFFDSDGRFDRGEVYNIEDHALTQIAIRLDIPPAYLLRCPGEVRAVNLNYWLGDLVKRAEQSRRVNSNLFVRTYGDTVRSFLTDRYEPVDNTTVLRTAHELLPPERNGYRLVRPNVGRDDVYLRITVLEGIGPKGDYGFGAYIHNGETGRRGLMVAPFLQRTSCTNSTIWTTEAFKVRHVHSARHSAGWLIANVKEYLGRAFRLGDKMVENVVAAEAVKIPDLHNVVADLARKYKMSREEERMTLLGTENEKTKLGVINGLTFMARQLDDPDRQLQFEGLAGAILAEPGSLFDVAAKKAHQSLLEI